MTHKDLILELFPIWKLSQIDLSKTIRWKEHLKGNPEMRRQSVLDHTLSFSIVSTIALMLMQPYKKLNEALLQKAFLIHDLPEGILRRDINAQKKQDEDDRDEFLAFEDKFRHLPDDAYIELRKAYLLQFARRNPDCFPEHARAVMEDIVEKNFYEAVAFEALEKWEYIFYALETSQDQTHPYLFTKVLCDNLPQLQEYAEILPGFREAVFTHEFEGYIKKYLEVNRHTIPK